ncbi:hypothetical protein M422DRAFT_778333 [Sphaerobolus stellatus SS14]|uniref:Uncharacterized protein n=1 Tax=Sphaerobolus stellatus (strain SS14) TaxID=990650 RepID=A0A0C9UV60_SPHS4|nr:hypothetical protein M422DRAFT_778333 [Sphaerobolus stellatus SS14]
MLGSPILGSMVVARASEEHEGPGKATAAQDVDRRITLKHLWLEQMRVAFEAARTTAECRTGDQEVKESGTRIGLLEQEKLIEGGVLPKSYAWAQPELVSAPLATPLPSTHSIPVYVPFPHYSQDSGDEIKFPADDGVMVTDTVPGVDAGEPVDVEQPTAGPSRTTHESDG